MSSSLPDGYTARAAGEADAEAVSDVVTAADVAVQGWSESTPDEIRSFWRLVKGEPFVIERDDATVACCTIFEHGDNVELDGFVHPDHKGRGIGSWILGRAEDEARRRAKPTLMTWCLEPDADARRLFEQFGLREVRRYYRMAADLDGGIPDPVWPKGLEVRTFRREDARAFHAALAEAFAEEWNFVSESFDDWRRRRLEAPDSDFSRWFVVWDGDEVAAVLRGDRRGDAAWVGALGVRRPWRRRGIGLALLQHAFHEFRRQGETHAALGVDAQNPTGATRLYDRAGMRVAYIGLAFAKEVA